jgi:hypothetical protein
MAIDVSHEARDAALTMSEPGAPAKLRRVNGPDAVESGRWTVIQGHGNALLLS